jgi:hypothetical protein
MHVCGRACKLTYTIACLKNYPEQRACCAGQHGASESCRERGQRTGQDTRHDAPRAEAAGVGLVGAGRGVYTTRGLRDAHATNPSRSYVVYARGQLRSIDSMGSVVCECGECMRRGSACMHACDGDDVASQPGFCVPACCLR